MLSGLAPEDQVAGERLGIQLPACGRVVQQRPWVAGEAEAVPVTHVVKRLVAQMVAGPEQSVPPLVVYDEREHPVEMVHAIFAPGGVGVEDGLGVRSRVGARSRPGQLFAELPAVVELTVEDPAQAMLPASRRLGAACCPCMSGNAAHDK